MTYWPSNYSSFCHSVSWGGWFYVSDSVGWVHFQWVGRVGFLNLWSWGSHLRWQRIHKGGTKQRNKIVSANIYWMLTVSSTTLRALYVFTPLILTCEVGIIIIILILQARKQRYSKFKDLAHGNTTSDLQSQDSYTGQCHGVGVTSCYPPCPDRNPYGWVPLSSCSTLLLVPSVGDETIAFACIHKSESSPSF